MIEKLCTFKDTIQKDGVICCFSGPFTQDLLIGIGETLKKKMELDGESMSTAMDLFSIFVEETQNIIRHSAERLPVTKYKPEAGSTLDALQSEATKVHSLALGIIVIGQKDDCYYVQGGNYIENDKVEAIRNKLNTLRNMNKEELKNYYKEQRKRKSHNNWNDTGLGFIEVARKVSRPIEFKFEKIDDTYSFFSFLAMM
ncbi:MAG: SiaB family protein kinase [Spirochaetales bacterium]|nr:SiaB family protein kinase [Spirochaetales bacterium]